VLRVPAHNRELRDSCTPQAGGLAGWQRQFKKFQGVGAQEDQDMENKQPLSA
jgi:hypothetical protein